MNLPRQEAGSQIKQSYVFRFRPFVPTTLMRVAEPFDCLVLLRTRDRLMSELQRA
jgi:hypothetical protein